MKDLESKKEDASESAATEKAESNPGSYTTVDHSNGQRVDFPVKIVGDKEKGDGHNNDWSKFEKGPTGA